MPDEYDLLIYGHRPQLLEHLAELYPRHIQIHNRRYRREQLFEAARCSRVCAYLAEDDHGPLALQEILLFCCPAVGVRTNASSVRNGATGFLVDRLPPGQYCVANEVDAIALSRYIYAVYTVQSLDRRQVQATSEETFDSQNIVDRIAAAIAEIRTFSQRTGLT